MKSGDGVSLRRLKQADAQPLAKLANNKNIWNRVRDLMPHPYTEQDAINSSIKLLQKTPKQTFGILIENSLAGVIGLHILSDVYRKTAEMGYWIGEEYWNRGIATKAVELITDYGFKELKLIRIQSSVFEINMASMKVLEKNGFELEGIALKAIVKNERILNEHKYAKTT